MTPELESAAAEPAASEGALLAQRHELEDPAEPPLAVALVAEIDYAERVQRGAALLDVKWPTWAQDIDLDTLDIAESSSCMTAQYDAFMQRAEGREYISGWYAGGMERLDIGDNETYAAHGFNGDYTYDGNGEYTGVTPGAFDALNRLWRDLITERRSAAQPEASER